jgi:pimeloyl-ACP methyl ester carboxylesterase
MPNKSNTIVFLAGLGAPIQLYHPLLEIIREQIPHQAFHTMEWWNQNDYGKNEIQRYLQHSNAILIGHSSGGSMAIQALVDSPDKIQRVVMLDSHAPTATKPLPSIEKFLDTILSPDSTEIIAKVRNAYAPLVNDSTAFDRAFEYLSQWVKYDLPKVGSTIKSMQDHTVLHMGFTNSHYQVLDAKEEHELITLWGQYHFDTQFLPMSHFELIKPSHAKIVVEKISSWLG